MNFDGSIHSNLNNFKKDSEKYLRYVNIYGGIFQKPFQVLQ